MADILLFMKFGWKNLWKINIIWLFSALSIAGDLTRFIARNQEDSLSAQFIFLMCRFLLIFFSFISLIAVPYLAYCFSIGETATIQKTIEAVKKFSLRIIGYSFLFFLVLSPFFCWALAVSATNSSLRPIQLSDQTILAFFPFALFSSMWDFTRLGFFCV